MLWLFTFTLISCSKLKKANIEQKKELAHISQSKEDNVKKQVMCMQLISHLKDNLSENWILESIFYSEREKACLYIYSTKSNGYISYHLANGSSVWPRTERIAFCDASWAIIHPQSVKREMETIVDTWSLYCSGFSIAVKKVYE